MKLRAAVLVLAIGLSACVPVTRPVVKIGLVAPFEGRYREVGYEVIYAVRLAVRETNAVGGVAGYSIELLALDDSGDPEMATAQARKMATDPQVVGGIGHWLEATTLAAAPEYAAANIPFLATAAADELDPSAFRLWPTATAINAALPNAAHCPAPCDSLENLDWLLAQSKIRNPQSTIIGPPLWGQPQFAQLAGPAAEGVYFVAPAPLPADLPPSISGGSSNLTFADRYRAISNGVEPRANAVLAYDATRLLLAAIARDAQLHGTPTRAGVLAALTQTNYTGLSGHFSFDANRQWTEATGWVYQWRAGQTVRP